MLNQVKKKMLIVGRGNEIGGGTEYLVTLIKMLHDNFNVDIHMTYGKEKVKDNYQQYFDYVTFHHISMVREINPIHDFQSIRKLYSLIKREKFDIVHTNSSKGGIVGRIAARFAKVQFVFHTVHGFSFHEQSSRWAITAFSLIEKIGAKCCNNIITVSDFHRDWAIDLGIATSNKIISIPNGLDPTRVEPTMEREDIRELMGIDNKEISIFTIGRLATQKGITYLLNAIKLLEEENITNIYHLYIAGSGELDKELKDQVKNSGIEYKVTFLGHRTDINNLLAAADIIVLPSLWEGLSISLLEAMAAKKAIICTNIGSNMTVVKHNKEAMIVEAKDVEGLKSNIKLLVENQVLRETLAKQSYERFASSFSKDVMLKGYHTFYTEIANLDHKSSDTDIVHIQ